ncbi:MAG: ECF transporter S component [Clostridiales Family XIII bacterium]|jgi:riboflavin transporter FmnP|nr:ECF transporter S component [Clostridiales Family XIII bacterium]
MQSKALKVTVATALLAAIAFILIFIRTPIPFMPPFMDFDLCGVPEVIGTFALGPVAGSLIAIIKIVLKSITQGSMSMGTGELCNAILSLSYILSTYIVWYGLKRKWTNKPGLSMQGGSANAARENIKAETKAAAIGMVVGTLFVTVIACVLNVYIIFPFYAKAYGMDFSAIIAMITAANPYVKSTFGAVLLGIAPFNIIKYGITSIVVGIIYSRTIPIMKRLIK